MNWKHSVRFSLLIALVIFSASFVVRADSPSPNNWTFGGGGFCKGTYTVFNSTDNKLYAQNCATGANDCGGFTDFGSLMNTCVIPDMPNGGEVDMRQGFFAASTTTNIGRNAFTLRGSSIFAGSNAGISGANQWNGTNIVAKTNAMTVIAESSSSGSVTCVISGCTGAPWYQGDTFSDFAVQGNCLASIGIDWASLEVASLSRFTNIAVTDNAGCGFTTAMIVDGNEDTILDEMIFGGAGTLATGSATLDLQWQVPAGNVVVENSYFGGLTNIATWGQTIMILTTTVSSVKILGQSDAIFFSSNYIGNGQGTGRLNLNGQTVDVVTFNGDWITTTASIPFITGTGTLNNLGFGGTDWGFPAGASQWNNNAATLTKQNTAGTNHVRSGTTPTNFPFTRDGNNNF